MSKTAIQSAVSLALFASLFSAAGCDRDAPRGDGVVSRPAPDGKVGTTPATDKATLSNEAALASIVGARCQREARCNNVGNTKRWASAEACRGDLTAKGRDDLRASECPGGVVQKELQECLAEIQNEDCNNPLDTLGRLAACRTSDLCKATGI